MSQHIQGKRKTLDLAPSKMQSLEVSPGLCIVRAPWGAEWKKNRAYSPYRSPWRPISSHLELGLENGKHPHDPQMCKSSVCRIIEPFGLQWHEAKHQCKHVCLLWRRMERGACRRTSPYIKQIANRDLLSGSGNSNRGSVSAEREG